jgi:hypothetical protein
VLVSSYFCCPLERIEWQFEHVTFFGLMGLMVIHISSLLLKKKKVEEGLTQEVKSHRTEFAERCSGSSWDLLLSVLAQCCAPFKPHSDLRIDLQ